MRFFARAAILGTLLLSTAAHAQTADDPSTEARKHFDAGLEHYKANRFAEALTEFQEANRISPRATLQRNVAQTQRDLHDYASAYESYDKLLKVYGSSLKSDEKTAAEKALEELATLTGEIAFFINLPDAVAMVDGKDRGAPPLTVRANSGPHKVAVRAPGYTTLEQNVDLRGRDKVAIQGPLEKAGVETRPAAGVTVPVPRTIEPPPVQSTAELEKFIGIYGRVELMGVFPMVQNNTVVDGRVYGSTVNVDSSGLYGGGMGVHVGYSFGHFGIEGVLTGAYDHASARANLPTRKDDWNFYRSGGVLGVAGRFMPHFDQLGPFRPTAGAMIGLAGRAVGYQRMVADTTNKDKASFEFYVAPSMMFDIGFTVGNTPGAKFYLGFMMMLEFAGGKELPSGNSKDGRFPIPATSKVEAANGVDIFIGPTLGLAFGH